MYITVGRCPICGSENWKEDTMCVGPKIDYSPIPDLLYHVGMLATYRLCAGCGVWYQKERLDDEHLALFYSSGEYRRTIGGTEAEIDKEELDRAKYDAPLILANKPNPYNHLDVGCSHGQLLHEVGAKMQFGIELDTNRILYPNIQHRVSFFDVAHEFDVVSCIHNLEHVPGPMGQLHLMVKYLAPGGILVLEVPSKKSHGGPFRFAHLFVFDENVIRYMLDKVGMVIERLIMTPHLFVIAKRKSEHEVVTVANVQALNVEVAA